jgi:hypothetical protein
MKLSVYLMHLQLAVICFGCWKGMQSDLAPIEGAPGSRSASALLISLIWSSHSMSPQNGAWNIVIKVLMLTVLVKLIIL